MNNKEYGIDFKQDGKLVKELVCESLEQRDALMVVWEEGGDHESFPAFGESDTACAWERPSARDRAIIRNAARSMMNRDNRHLSGRFRHGQRSW